MFNNKYIICIILYLFLLIFILNNYKIEKLTSQYDYYSPKKAIDSKTPILVLFYDGLENSRLSASDKKKVQEKNNIYMKEFDAASENSTLPFYQLDLSWDLTKSVWGKRLPSYGPVIIFYNNASNGAGKDGKDILKKNSKNDILQYLLKKVKN